MASRKRSASFGESDKNRSDGTAERPSSSSDKIDNKESLDNISRGSVGKLLKRANRRGSKGFNVEECSYLQPCNSTGKLNTGIEKSNKPCNDTTKQRDILKAASHCEDLGLEIYPEKEIKGVNVMLSEASGDDEQDDIEWEDGSVPISRSVNDVNRGLVEGVNVEFDALPTPTKRKVRRATAEEKEAAELVHKVHLLCLIARGRIIDRTCDDPLIQVALRSILPMHFLKISDVPRITAKALTPLVNWVHSNFQTRSTVGAEKPFNSALASALETRGGTPEEVVALSVALFRALKLPARFVSILDVAPLKPDADKSESPGLAPTNKGSRIFNSSTLMVPGSSHQHVSAAESPAANKKENSCMIPKSGTATSSSSGDHQNASHASLFAKKLEGLKRRGDLEYELQLEMALSATSVGGMQNDTSSDMPSSSTSNILRSFKRIKNVGTAEPTYNGISTVIGSKKVGAPLFWAEVYCGGEALSGKWVHVDVVNSITDGEKQVEAAATACKKSLRYVVAFAGQGAKDVTRRYCTKWHKIVSRRLNSTWWDEVLAPLKQLESAGFNIRENREHGRDSDAASIEDMELETRALMEPLPTNQQAYRNHPLYAIERWLGKYQQLHPRGPVVGFCSGHPVYPRTCVQTLHTKIRWLREGLQVKANELPAKVLNRSQKNSKAPDAEDNDECTDGDCGGTIDLFGKWQTEPLYLPRAVGGIVPRNERGQVDVWSEKCLPLGTVHLKLPRGAAIAKRLGIDSAPAMVGFEFRNGKSIPSYEGIVVCAEFKDAIIEAYAEEEVRREAEEHRKNEAQALKRWYQLLSSIITRRRLRNCYGGGSS